MCLYVNTNAVPAVAEEDITVYKLVQKLEDGSLVTPFRNAEYAVGKTTITYLQPEATYRNFVNRTYNSLNDDAPVYMTDIMPDLVTHDESNHSRINVGEITCGIHSFVDLNDAITLAREGINEHEVDMVVLKCTIPAGSQLYSGSWLYVNSKAILVYPNYASSTLTVDEIVEN